MKYKITPEWLYRKYIVELAHVKDMATEVGCSVANIKKHLELNNLKRGKVLQKKGIVKSWNEGLSKNDDARLKRLSESHSGAGNPMHGKRAWNGGLTKENSESLQRVSDKLTGRNIPEGTREKMRKAKVGKFGELANNWQGGVQYRNGYGVHRRTACGRRMYAHRLVAEQVLGRPLKRSEHVHHVDRNKANNDPKNLIIIRNNRDHRLLHCKCIDSGIETREGQIDWLIENGIEFETLV